MKIIFQFYLKYASLQIQWIFEFFVVFRFQQIVGVHTFQAYSEQIKVGASFIVGQIGLI